VKHITLALVAAFAIGLGWSSAYGQQTRTIRVDAGPTFEDGIDFGALEPRVEALESFSEYAFRSADSLLVASFPRDITARPIVVTHADSSHALELRRGSAVWRSEAGDVVSRFPLRASQPVTLPGAEVVRYAGVYANATDEYRIEASQLKHELVLSESPVDGIDGWFGSDVTLLLPIGASLEMVGFDGHASFTSARITTDAGQTTYELPAVVAYDANGSQIAGRYRLLADSGRAVTIAMEVPAAELLRASYPVRIDPTIQVSNTGGSNSFPMNATAMRYQSNYTVAQLQGTAGQITEFGYQHSNPFTANYPRVIITMCETSTTPSSYSLEYDLNFNIGSPVVCYDGPVTLTSSASGSFAMIQLTTPFVYSGANDLLVEARVYPGRVFTSGSSASHRATTNGSTNYRLYNSTTTEIGRAHV